MENIQVLKPYYRVDETLAEIKECLDIGWTGMGFKTEKIEEKWLEYTGLNNAYFVNSATSGLHLAFKELKEQFGWKDGDEVITTPFTFVSTNHAIKYENLKPVFADVDEFLCLDPEDVERKITDGTKAVIFVGLGGSIGQYYKIVELCGRYDLKLILDAAHMAGTRYKGEIVGKEADVVVYSYQAVKNMPTADSGMLCFRDDSLDKKARELGWLGITKDTFSRTTNKGAYKWKYDVPNVGYKYHGNSIMAAMALVSLKYLDKDNEYRRTLSKWYHEKLESIVSNGKVSFIPQPEGLESSTHVVQVLVENRDQVLESFYLSNVYPGVHYTLNTEYEPYLQTENSCPNAIRYADRIISLPVHLDLREEQIDYICKCLIDAV